MTLEDKINKYLKDIKTHDSQNIYLTAKEIKTIFLEGLKKQINLNFEHVFNFNVIPDENNGLYIECSLSNNFNVGCKILNEFMLKENENLTKQLLEDFESGEINIISSGTGKI